MLARVTDGRGQPRPRPGHSLLRGFRSKHVRIQRRIQPHRSDLLTRSPFGQQGLDLHLLLFDQLLLPGDLSRFSQRAKIQKRPKKNMSENVRHARGDICFLECIAT